MQFQTALQARSLQSSGFNAASIGPAQNAFDMLKLGQARAAGSSAKAGAASFALNSHGVAAAAAAPMVPQEPAALPAALAQPFDTRLQHSGPQAGDPWWTVLVDYVPLALLRVRYCAIALVLDLLELCILHSELG
jgi:hypothetical protein